MITCHTCNFSDPRAVRGSKSELQYLSVGYACDANSDKVFFCTFDCYLEKCLEREFFPKNVDDEEPRDLAAFEDYKNEHRETLAQELLKNSGVQDFLERTSAKISYKLPPQEMEIEIEIESWADM